MQGGYAIRAGQLNVHENQVGLFRLGQMDAVFSRLGLQCAKALELQKVSHQFEVLLVVFDDENEFTSHGGLLACLRLRACLSWDAARPAYAAVAEHKAR